MKNELGGKIMKKFIGLIVKTYLLIDDGSEDEQARQKKYVIKRKLQFQNYKNCFEATQFENEINYIEKNKINIDSIK